MSRIEDLNQTSSRPMDILGSKAHSEVVQELSSGSFLRQGDRALGAVVGGNHSRENYIVQDNKGGSYLDFAMAGDIYKSPFSTSAKETADEKLKAAALA